MIKERKKKKVIDKRKVREIDREKSKELRMLTREERDGRKTI